MVSQAIWKDKNRREKNDYLNVKNEIDGKVRFIAK